MTRRRWMHLGDGLKLPLEAVTAAGVITGQRGTGKSSTAVVEVEEAHDCGAPSVIIDPTGVWWGIRHGERPLDHVLFGSFRGAEADLPLRPEDGPALARLVAANRISVVLGLRGWTKAQQVRFVAEFCEAFYLANHTPVLLVIDEAHRFAPAQLRDSERGGYGARCLGSVVDIVTLGRVNGIGARLITQRMARLHADVRESCEIVIAHRLMGSNDRKAFALWLEDAGEDPDVAADMLKRLPRLQTGEALAIAPTFDVLGGFTIRPKRTYDSSATPEVGAAIVEPKGRADVDLRVVERELGEALEEARAQDPKALREERDELRRQLADAQADLDRAHGEHAADAESLMTERNLSQSELDDLAEFLGLPKDGAHGAVRDRVRQLSGRIADLERALALRPDVFGALLSIGSDAQRIADYARTLQREFRLDGKVPADPLTREQRDYYRAEAARTAGVPTDEDFKAAQKGTGPPIHVSYEDGEMSYSFEQADGARASAPAGEEGVQSPTAPVPPAAGDAERGSEPNGGRVRPVAPASAGGNAAGPGGTDEQPGPRLVAGARRMLDVLARYGPLTRAELATLAKSHGGAMRRNIGALKEAGLVVEEDGRVRHTTEGAAEARPPGSVAQRPYTAEEIVAMYHGQLVAGARRILDVLMRAPDKGFTRKELEGLAGSHGGAFRRNIGALKRAGLIEERSRRVYPSHVLYADEIAKRRS